MVYDLLSFVKTLYYSWLSQIFQTMLKEIVLGHKAPFLVYTKIVSL